PAMLVAAIGRGNFVQSADELLAAKLDELREENASQAMLDAARRELGPAGELWWFDLATGEPRGKFAAGDTILGGAAVDERGLAFGSRDGHVYRLSHTGELLARWHAREPIVTSLVAGRDSLHAVVRSGRLYALDRETLVPRWDMRLGDGENFLSSPVLARRRLFVGTPANGLRCVGLGTPPAPPLWNSGATGGPADDRQLPEQAALAWKVGPSKPVSSPRLWCPTPTPSSIVVVQSEEADRAGAEKAEESRVTRVIAYPVEKSATNGQTAPAPHGSWQLEGTPSLPPAAVGDRLILAFDRILVAIDTASGSRPPRWQVQLESPSPVSMAVDHQRIVLVNGQRLESRSIETGELLFTVPHHLEAVNRAALADGPEVAGTDIDATASEPPMALHLADDLLVVARGASWALFDAPTGRPLPFPKPFPHPFPQLGLPRADAMSTSLAGPNQGLGPRGRFLWRADATVVLVDDRGCTQMELERLERSRQLFANATSLLAALPITPAASNAAPGSTSNTRFLTLSKAGDLRLFESPFKTPLEAPLEPPLEPSTSSTKDANTANTADTAATEITATPNWELAGLAPRPPLVAYPAVVAARDAALIRINVDDGQESDWFRWSDANLAPATPLVAVRGRVYYMTAEGSLVCLAEAP
ncbi:MAG: PQQ-binding-like beta-propeller repeat protein, partial [Planctomycetota bacterium]